MILDENAEAEDGSYEWRIDQGAIHITGGDGSGLLHDVYAFAEAYLGVRYTIAGDRKTAPQPLPSNETNAAALNAQIRGTLPWHNFLCGSTGWNEADYFAYIDQMAKLRFNLVMFHVYTGGLLRY